MTKRAPLQQFQKVKEKLAKVGIAIKRNLDTEEYQVYPKGDEPGGRSTGFTGSLSEEDLEDALGMGLMVAERLKARKARQNPKCKTIEVKRKIRILGKPRVVKVKRKICNPELDLARLERSLVHELIEYDKKLTAKDRNIYRMGHYLKAVEKAFDDLKQIDDPTLQDMKKAISERFDPQLPPVKKFLKKYT